MKLKQIIAAILLFSSFLTFAQQKKYTTYRVSSNETVISISSKLGITPYDLLKLNPDAKDGINIDEVLIVPEQNSTTLNPLKKKFSKIKIPKSYSPKKDSISNGYLYHTVKAYETIYSLSRKYKTSKRKVRKLNKLSRKSSISIGQVLKFPTKLKNSISIKTNTVKTIVTPSPVFTAGKEYITYTVKLHDTFYNLERLYKVSKEELIKVNPKLLNGLKVNDQIFIAVKSNVVEGISGFEEGITNVPTYTVYTVKLKDSFYGLKQIYGFTKEEFLAVNPDFEGTLMLNSKINIPNSKSEVQLVEEAMIGKVLNVVMMLPFKAKNGSDFSNKTKDSKFLNKVTDFYFGAVMALDELKSKGLSVNLKVLDTEKNAWKINSLLDQNDLSSTDVVIGPLVYDNFKEVANYLKGKNIPLISPISKTDHSKIYSKNVIQNKATTAQLEKAMIDYIKANYTNQKIIIIGDEISSDDEKAKHVKVTMLNLKSEIQKNDSIKKVLTLNMKDKFTIDRELFTDNIKANRETWVILASGAKNSIWAIMDNLSAFSSEFKITLFALNKSKTISKIENHKLNRLNFHYPSSNYIDQDSEDVFAFKQNYKNRYSADPTNFSYRGYDTTYDALVRLANNKDMKIAFEEGVSKRLNTKFSYIKKPMAGYINDGVFILKYDNFNLKAVK